MVEPLEDEVKIIPEHIQKNISDEPNESNPERGNSYGPLATAAAIGAAVILAIGYVIFGPKAPENYTLKGVVREERALYGNVVSGYSTDRPGIMGKLERLGNDVIRPGAEWHLYGLQVTHIEFDKRGWFGATEHVVEGIDPTNPEYAEELSQMLGESYNPAQSTFFLQTTSDVADAGDTFTSTRGGLGRFSNTFAVRGVNYSHTDEEGNTTTMTLHGILKNPTGIEFTQNE